MTAICGVVSENGVYLGADRAVSNIWGNTSVMNHPKVFRNGPCLMAFAGNPRPAQIAEFHMEPENLKNRNEMEWCVNALVPSLNAVFAESEYAPEEEDFCFIVAVGNRIFSLTPDFAVIETTNKYISLGDGEQYCNGVFSAIGVEPPEQCIESALKSAEQNCGSVLGPFDIVKL